MHRTPPPAAALCTADTTGSRRRRRPRRRCRAREARRDSWGPRDGQARAVGLVRETHDHDHDRGHGHGPCLDPSHPGDHHPVLDRDVHLDRPDPAGIRSRTDSYVDDTRTHSAILRLVLVVVVVGRPELQVETFRLELSVKSAASIWTRPSVYVLYGD